MRDGSAGRIDEDQRRDVHCLIGRKCGRNGAEMFCEYVLFGVLSTYRELIMKAQGSGEMMS
jgi:hypothetical protein